jgi:hypothetical protein
MASSRTRTHLSADQLDRIAQIVMEEFGSRLSQQQFADVVLGLFENIAGLETLTERSGAELARRLWSKYQAGRR